MLNDTFFVIFKHCEQAQVLLLLKEVKIRVAHILYYDSCSSRILCLPCIEKNQSVCSCLEQLLSIDKRKKQDSSSEMTLQNSQQRWQNCDDVYTGWSLDRPDVSDTNFNSTRPIIRMDILCSQSHQNSSRLPSNFCYTNVKIREKLVRWCVNTKIYRISTSAKLQNVLWKIDVDGIMSNFFLNIFQKCSTW